MRQLRCSDFLDNIDDIKRFIEFFLPKNFIREQKKTLQILQNKLNEQYLIPETIHPMIEVLECINYLISKNPETIDEKYLDVLNDLLNLSVIVKYVFKNFGRDFSNMSTPEQIQSWRNRFKDKNNVKHLVYEFLMAYVLQEVGKSPEFTFEQTKKWPDLRVKEKDEAYLECKKLRGPNHISKIHIVTDTIRKLNEHNKNGLIILSSKEFPDQPKQLRLIPQLVEKVISSNSNEATESGITVKFEPMDSIHHGAGIHFSQNSKFEYMMTSGQFKMNSDGTQTWKNPRSVTIHSEEIPLPFKQIKNHISKAYKQLKNVPDRFLRLLAIDITGFVDVGYIKDESEHDTIIQKTQDYIQSIFKKVDYKKLSGIILTWNIVRREPARIGPSFEARVIINENSIKPVSKHYLNKEHHQFTQFFERGVELAKIGKHKEALLCFREITQRWPNIIDGWHNEGISLMNLGKIKDAINCFTNAIKIDSKFEPALTSMANCYNKLGMFNTSLETLEKILEFKPNHAQTWYNKAGVYEVINDFENARKCAFQCLEYDPNYQNALDLLNRLERISSLSN